VVVVEVAVIVCCGGGGGGGEGGDDVWWWRWYLWVARAGTEVCVDVSHPPVLVGDPCVCVYVRE